MTDTDERVRSIAGEKGEYAILAPRLTEDECKTMFFHLENRGDLPIPDEKKKQQKCLEVTLNGINYFIIYVNERFAVMRNE